MTDVIATLLLDLLFPRTCPLCGGTRPPLCPPQETVCSRCRGSLRYIDGESCRSCGAPLISEIGLCLQCREEDRVPIDKGFQRAYSLYPYRDLHRELIQQYKFKGKRYLSRFFAAEMIRRFGAGLFQGAIVPVPSEPGNRKARGWDPVLLLARDIARRSGGRVHRCLHRKPSRSQKGLDREERLKNLTDKISVVGPIPEGDVTLIDDVWTTGATVEACSRSLLQEGCSSVVAITLVRG